MASGFPLCAHHVLLLEKLQACALGKSEKPNLAIFLPPGSAKSTYSSVAFPLWFLCAKPASAILACSHNVDLAASFGRRCRNLVEEYEKELGYTLSPDSKAADKWHTTKGGGYLAAGVGTKIAGRRADLGLIDDPIGSKEDAESKIVRDKQWDWYEFDFKTRLKPGAPTVLIQTRWHEDDLAGRILANEPEDWEVIRIPLIAEKDDPLGRVEGVPLWPEYFTDKHVENAKKSSAFISLYQCRPSPEEGDYFKREWIDAAVYTNIDALKGKQLRYFVASDHALTTKEENDRHCLIPFAVDEYDDIWILPDVWWKRADTLELVESMLDIVERRRPIEWFAEDEHIFKSIGPFLNKRQQERQTYCAFTGLGSNKDLQSRASSIRGRMKMCKVHLPAFAHWFHEAKHELLSFPVGTHDDFVAALAKIGQGMDRITKPSAPEPKAHEPLNYNWHPTAAWLKASHKRQEQKKQPLYGGR